MRRFKRGTYSIKRGEWVCEDVGIKERKLQIVKDRMAGKLSKNKFEDLQKEMRSDRGEWKHLYYESELPEGSIIIE